VKKSLHRLLRKEELARYQLSRGYCCSLMDTMEFEIFGDSYSGSRRQLAAATKDLVKWKAAIWEKDSIEPAMLRYLSAQLN
jgi:hypothetical protein